MYKQRLQIEKHLQEHATIYIFMIILFITGVIFGALIVNSMGFVQKQDLFFTLERFFGQIIDQEKIEARAIFKSGYFHHVKYLLLLFIAGLSVIGLPLVWILLFFKGLLIGFSVGFIVNQLGMQGFLIASLAIAPQNILIIPIYIIAGSLSMIFSLTLFGKLFSRTISKPILEPFIRYMFLFFVLLCCAIAPSFIESFLSNYALQLLVEGLYS